MPGSSEGTRIGIIVIDWNSPLSGMQLRVSAYANVNPMVTVMNVVIDATWRLFQMEYVRAGVEK